MKVGDGHAFATGYYEPEIEGSRTPQPGYVPIYRLPPDLVRCTKADGTTGRGRIDETGACVLYYTRAEIEDGALNGKGLELAWAKDPIDLFFLEIQGSGRIRFDDGTVMRVGYAGQNGRDYVAIGRLLRDRGILPPGGANMQAIKDWIRANPDQGRELMRENLSYVFFKELTGPGPLGALNVPVTPHGRVAADPNYVPLGAPIYLAQGRPAGGRRAVGRAGHRRRDQGAEPLRHLLGGRPGGGRDRRRHVGLGRGADPDPQGHRGACARSALKKPSSGRGLRRPSGRCRRETPSRPLRRGRRSPAPAPTARRRPPPPPAAAAAAPHSRSPTRRSTAAGTSAAQRRASSPTGSLDLHGMNLDSAWTAIDRSLDQAIARGDRVLLLITGHHRPGEPPVQRGQDPRGGP